MPKSDFSQKVNVSASVQNYPTAFYLISLKSSGSIFYVVKRKKRKRIVQHCIINYNVKDTMPEGQYVYSSKRKSTKCLMYGTVPQWSSKPQKYNLYHHKLETVYISGLSEIYSLLKSSICKTRNQNSRQSIFPSFTI